MRFFSAALRDGAILIFGVVAAGDSRPRSRKHGGGTNNSTTLFGPLAGTRQQASYSSPPPPPIPRVLCISFLPPTLILRTLLPFHAVSSFSPLHRIVLRLVLSPRFSSCLMSWRSTEVDDVELGPPRLLWCTQLLHSTGLTVLSQKRVDSGDPDSALIGRLLQLQRS